MPQTRKSAASGDQLRRMLNPLDLVVISRTSLQEVVDEAVRRGRITRSDAAELVSELIARGWGQADDVFEELEQLMRAPFEAARRVAGLGPEFPISGYDDMTAAEIVGELDGMGADDLRRVREYERANANRKTVLNAVERKLG